jgi:benzoate membrane transport protein
MPPRPDGVAQPVLAGLVASIVGFGGAFAVVLAGLRAVGATPAQAASGLLVLSVTMGLLGLWLSLRLRMPVSIAWSTPGAALLISVGAPEGGWPAALGAFVVAGVLIALAGLLRPLGRWIAAIPAPIASAMLAGVLLSVCVAPAEAVVDAPLRAAPVLVTWAVLFRLARRWAVPGAVLAVLAVIAVDPPAGGVGPVGLPALEAAAPTFGLAAIVSLALPLFLVTMASQNITGMAVLAGFGYRPPLRPILLSTGAVSALTAPFGAHGLNLAAISAALVAGPEAGPDPARRWIAAATGGVAYVALGLAAGAATVLLAAAPLLVAAVAGLALLGALAASLAAAMQDADRREAAVVTFVVSASGVTAAGISAPFWGLVAGLAFLALQRARPGG